MSDNGKLSEFLLPDDLIEELQQGEESVDAWRWRSGEIAADLVDEFGATRGKGLVRKRVAIEAVLPASTIRAREEMARFYPSELRHRFGDEDYPGFQVLSWSQLRACKPAGMLGWRELALWAVESADDYGGRPAPVDAIVAKRTGWQPDEQTWEKPFTSAWNACEKLLETQGVPKKVRDSAETFIESTKKWHEKITEYEKAS